VAHVPYWASPIRPTVPTVVTVHDLIPLLLPLYRGSALVRLYTRLVAAAARRADYVITDSLASQADIVAHLHIPAERVQVIYLAADPTCQPVADAEALAAVRAQYRLPDEYILYLGGFDARKNLRALLAAYARLRATQGEAIPPLVVAGRLPDVDTPLFPSPKRLARELGVQDAVRFTGWVAGLDKAALYSGALFFAFLSLYEGFGLMPLEAMACGTPVVASRRASLPEVVGDGGLLVDPDDTDAVVAAMTSLLQDSALRAALHERALAQASRFNWQRTAEETLAVYERVHR
jgi:glycosyltransferase involved in cell wall biosynthesis